MDKQHYFFRLIPPRPTFPADITPEEAALMKTHATYWAEHFAAGRVLAYGPVFDPAAAFGMGVLEVAAETEAVQFGENDPSVQAGLNRFKIYPMRLTGCRGKD